jgi:hypothetical protein
MPEVSNDPEDLRRTASHLSEVSASEIRSHHEAARLRGSVGHGPTGELFQGIVRRAEEAIARITASVAKVYEDTARGLERVAEQTLKDDASARAEFDRLAERRHEGPGGGPLGHGRRDDAGGDRRPSSLLRNDEGGVLRAGRGTTRRLGKVDEASVVRDASGRITSIDGESVDSYLSDLSVERRGAYRALAEDGSFSKTAQGPVVSVGLDRRTGVVYEGLNGKQSDVIPDADLHDTLRRNLAAMRRAGPYGDEHRDFPHPRDPRLHGEVKATNLALWERTAGGLPDGPEALGDMTISPDFTYQHGGGPAPLCANCDGMLAGMHSVHGRYTGFPHTDDNLIREDRLG